MTRDRGIGGSRNRDRTLRNGGLPTRFRVSLFPRFRSQEGFTLVELMVVLAILGILVALVVPRFLGTRKQAYSAEAVSILNEIKASEWSYFQRHDTFAKELDDLGFKPPAGSRWRYSIEEANEDRVVIKATGAVRPLEPTDTLTLTLTAEGEAKLESSF